MSVLNKTRIIKGIMGGNAIAKNSVTGEPLLYNDKPIQAQQVDLRVIDRKTLRKDLIDAFVSLDSKFEAKYGEPLWEDATGLFYSNGNFSGVAFNGSSEHFFSNAISDESMLKKKPTMGDVDLTIPKEKLQDLFDLLLDLEGSQISPHVTYMGQNNTQKDFYLSQINSIFAYEYEPGTDPLFIQVDFESSDYEGNRPTEFAKFSHSSSWEDINAGLKGVFHKYIIRSLADILSKMEDVVVLQKKSLLWPPSARKISASSTPVKMYSFSVDSGLRSAYELQKYKEEDLAKGEEYKQQKSKKKKLASPEDELPLPNVGDVVEVDGKTAYKLLEPKESTYVNVVSEIMKLLFKEKMGEDYQPTSEDVNLFGSFVGILRLMKKYLDNDEIESVYQNFVDWKLFDSASQGLYINEPPEIAKEKDKSSKMAAVNQFRKMFSFLEEPDSQKLESYYGVYKTREDKKIQQKTETPKEVSESLLRRYVRSMLRG